MQKLETLNQYSEFIQTFDTFLLDMDGVLWHGNQLLPGVQETLAYLHQLGKKLIFITNNSTKSRLAYVKKFQSLGIHHVQLNQIFGSAYIAACYLKSISFDVNKHIYIIGESGLKEELNELGFQTCGGLDDKDLRFEGVDTLSSIKPDSKIGAVLCGLDGHLNYLKLAKAHTYLMNPYVLFLATNLDPTFPTAGRTFPGAGSLFAPLIKSTGREPKVLGKPDKNVGQAIQAIHSFDLKKTCMVGDRLETDILFGQHIQCGATLLVLSGVTQHLNFVNETSSSYLTILPTHYMNCFGDFSRLCSSSST